MKFIDKPHGITAELKNKSLLITGGAGSIGSALTKKILEYPVKSVRILDINEHSLFKLKRELNDKRVRYDIVESNDFSPFMLILIFSKQNAI